MKIAINGFGRIGRLVMRAALTSKNKAAKNLQWVAVNDLTDAKTLAHLLKYDSTFGTLDAEVSAQDNALIVNGNRIEVLAVKEPKELPWGRLGVDYVVESTGRFTEADKAKGHLDAGAGKVLISAPAKGDDITICMGINEQKYDAAKHRIISNASCTTNCLAPLAKVINDNLGIETGYMLTIHAFTNDQPVLDFQHKDLRRARAAGQSMIPTSTGAAKAIGLVLPELAGKLNGSAIRVPTPDVSLVSFSAKVKKATAKEEINKLFRTASASEALQGFLAYNDLALVSKDFQGNTASCIFDATLTEVIDGTLVNVFGWYDNEWGYSNRVIDLLAFMACKEPHNTDAKTKGVAMKG